MSVPAIRERVNWSNAVSAFLTEKEHRTGSERTAHDYGLILIQLFKRVHTSPDRITPDQIISFAYGIGDSGREPAATTIRSRLAVVSSLYKFLIRMGLTDANPVDRIMRPRAEPPAPRGLTPDEIKRLLAATPPTPAGSRDRAIILCCVLTGRRRTEIVTLCGKDLRVTDDGIVFYTYRGKGNRIRTRQLPPPCVEAIDGFLRDLGKALHLLAPEEPVFPSTYGSGRAVSVHGFYLNFKRHMSNAGLAHVNGGVHILRHSAAKLRRDVGQSLEEVSGFLDHTNLAITARYLSRLEGETDTGWQQVTSLIS